MAVPKVDGQFIAEAIKYIDENGVPWHNTSTKYELVWENGNTYPPSSKSFAEWCRDRCIWI